jgi:hypothetical protein
MMMDSLNMLYISYKKLHIRISKRLNRLQVEAYHYTRWTNYLGCHLAKTPWGCGDIEHHISGANKTWIVLEYFKELEGTTSSIA